MVLDEEKQKLFLQIRQKLGYPVRKVELEDEQLCTCLELAVGQYAERVQNFIIESNWANLYGKNLSNTDLAFAMSVRSIDLAKDYSQYFSKEVGLQQRGNWELKKDFFEIELGRQVYIIPAGREINKVMWVTPSSVDMAVLGSWGGGIGVPFGGGVMGQLGIGACALFGGAGTAYGMGMAMLPAYDIALMGADLSYKNKLFGGELTYKVTAGPDGTHLVHLMSTPGSKTTFATINRAYEHAQVWYTYYDVTPENVDECRRENEGVLLSPDQVKLEEMDYSYFNYPTKCLIRQLMIAEAAETLGLIRGKFSGSIQMISSPLTMDYNMLLNMARTEKENALKSLDERLQRLSPYETMKKQSQLVQDIIATKKGVPLGIYMI